MGAAASKKKDTDPAKKSKIEALKQEEERRSRDLKKSIADGKTAQQLIRVNERDI